MKTKLIASTKRVFTIRLMWIIAIGWNKSHFQMDNYNVMEQEDWYFLCFRLQAIQWFKAAPANK